MTATAFADDPILQRPTESVDRTGAAAWLDPAAGRPRLQLIEGAGHVDVPAPRIDPMVEVYRRRRFAVALALTVLIIAATQALGISLTSFGPAPQADDSAPLVHVVRPGDTYAGIAATLGADDPATFADELRSANGQAELVVGQRLVVDLPGLG